MQPTDGDWQYKRVRGWFCGRDAVESVCDEQAQWGWQLVEVVSQYELRFGRSAAVALKDVGREGNPYATTSRVRTSGGNRAKIGALVGLSVALAVVLFMFMLVRSSVQEPAQATAVPLMLRERIVAAPAAVAGGDHGENVEIRARVGK